MTATIFSDVQREMHSSLSKTLRKSNNWLKQYSVLRCRISIHFDLTLPYHIKDVKRHFYGLAQEKNNVTSSASTLATNISWHNRITV